MALAGFAVLGAVACTPTPQVLAPVPQEIRGQMHCIGIPAPPLPQLVFEVPMRHWPCGVQQPIGQVVASQGGGAPHTPALHTWNGLHTFPHRPQLALLVLRSIQSCPQAQVPSGQVQVPAVQVWFSPHRLPHEPQLVMLVRRSSHRP